MFEFAVLDYYVVLMSWCVRYKPFSSPPVVTPQRLLLRRCIWLVQQKRICHVLHVFDMYLICFMPYPILLKQVRMPLAELPWQEQRTVVMPAPQRQ